MKRFLPWLVVMTVATGICWRFPLFHTVPLEQAQKEKAAATFNPAAFAEKFWTERLIPASDKAVKIEVLLPAIQADAVGAKKKYSRSVGVSESYTYFVAGQGRVVSVGDDEVLLAVTAGSTNAEVSLQAGLLFSNAVRDGSGLLNVSDYPDSQDFNGISEALNHIIETRVQPKLREQAKVGATISFIGCAEVNDESSDLKPLKVVPIEVRAQ